MGPHINPGGWREWRPGDTNYLDSVYYAESDSRGPGGNTQQRDPYLHMLSWAQANAFQPSAFPVGPDGWNPEENR
jgi:hypothetical protein